MSRQRYTEEFKVAAVRQVTVEGHSVPEVSKRLGITTKSLYEWKKRYGESAERAARFKADQAENQHPRNTLQFSTPADRLSVATTP